MKWLREHHLWVFFLFISLIFLSEISCLSESNQRLNANNPVPPSEGDDDDTPQPDPDETPVNYQYDEVTNQALPATSSQVKLFRLPYFLNSGAGDFLVTSDHKRLFQFDDTGLSYYDFSKPDNGWNVMVDYTAYQGINEDGLQSVVEDPLNPKVIYACGGFNTISDVTNDYQISADLANLFVSTNQGTSFKLLNRDDVSFIEGFDGYDTINGNGDYTGDEINQLLLRVTLGCSGRIQSRYTYEQSTNIEMGFVEARNPRALAFDKRVVAHINGEKVSGRIFMLSFLYGLFEGEVDEQGFYTWKNVFASPVAYDDFIDGGHNVALSDFSSFQYEPQTNDWTTEEIAHWIPTTNLSDYPLQNNNSCQVRLADGALITGSRYDAGCIEPSENYFVGAAVVTDEVSTDLNINPDGTNPAIVYAGFIEDDIFKNGGFYVMYFDTDGKLVKRFELKDRVTGQSLDVRDIAVDNSETIDITVTVGSTTHTFTVSKYLYIAAGKNGMYKGTVYPNGALWLEQINTGLYPREDFISDYLASNGTNYNLQYCGKAIERCGQYTNIDIGVVDNKLFLLSIDALGINFAYDDHHNPVEWKKILPVAGLGSTRTGALSKGEQYAFDYDGNYAGGIDGGLFDPITKEIYLSTDERVYKIHIDSLKDCVNQPASGLSYNCQSGHFEAFHKGYGDRSGYPVFDPLDPDHRLHLARLDGGYINSEWDDSFNQSDQRSTLNSDEGFCAGSYLLSEEDYTALDVDENNKLTTILDSSKTYKRQSQYGTKIAYGDMGNKKIMYVSGSDDKGPTDGFIYRAEFNSEKDKWIWKPAMGDGTCKAVYLFQNHTRDTCVQVCNADSAQSPLPYGAVTTFALSKKNANHVWVIIYNANTLKYELHASTNGGQTWTQQIYTDENGQDMGQLGLASDIEIDPQDGKSVFIAFNNGDLYYKNTVSSHFVNVTNVSTTLGTDALLGHGDNGSIAIINDIDSTVIDNKTHIFLAVSLRCGAGYGLYPLMDCQKPMGGGVYHATVSEGQVSSFEKLNTGSEDVEFFNANSVAVSPVDPQFIVSVGAGLYFSWASGGNIAELSAGAMYTKDGGVTWHKATDVPFNAVNVSAHPENKSVFIIGTANAGVWWLDVEASP